MTTSKTETPVWQKRTPLSGLLLWTGWVALVALFVWCWQVMNENTDLVLRHGRPAAGCSTSATACFRRAGATYPNC